MTLSKTKTPNIQTPRRATLADIARRAGVSKAAASVALNGSRSNTGVSDAVREHIQSVAREMNYRPNALARSLSRRRTNIVGVYDGYGFAAIRNLFLAEVVSGLQYGCRTYGQDLLLHVPSSGHSGAGLYDALTDGRIDGLALIAPEDDALVARLRETEFPAVSLADVLPGLPSVTADDAGGMALIARKIAEAGHVRAVLAHNAPLRGSAEERRIAFLREAAEYGVVAETATFGVNDPEGVLAFMRGLMMRGASERPTAMVCWNDATAHFIMGACRTTGIVVPDVLSVLSFDCLEPLDYAPAYLLSGVRVPWRQVGETAVKMLRAQADGEVVPLHTVLPVEWNAGGTF